MRRAVAPLGGLIAAPAAWAVSMQLGQILPYTDCRTGIAATAVASFAAALIALAGCFVSYRGYASTRARMGLFLSALSLLVGLSFAFALLLQGAASLLIDACAR